jgi:hypothetical protein
MPAKSPRQADEMIESACTDAPMGEGGEVNLLPFEFDARPVTACDYDSCVESGKCTGGKATLEDPDQCEVNAVGMKWKDAQAFCEMRGMIVQNPYHDFCIKDSLGEAYGLKTAIDADPTEFVTAGFRCVRILQDEN